MTLGVGMPLAALGVIVSVGLALWAGSTLRGAPARSDVGAFLVLALLPLALSASAASFNHLATLHEQVALGPAYGPVEAALATETLWQPIAVGVVCTAALLALGVTMSARPRDRGPSGADTN